MKAGHDYAAQADPAHNRHFSRTWGESPHSKDFSVVGSAAAEIISDVQFRQAVQRVHDLGARCLAELLAEIGVERAIMPAINEKLERYGNIDPEVLRALGGDKFSTSPLREVRSTS